MRHMQSDIMAAQDYSPTRETNQDSQEPSLQLAYAIGMAKSTSNMSGDSGYQSQMEDASKTIEPFPQVAWQDEFGQSASNYVSVTAPYDPSTNQYHHLPSQYEQSAIQYAQSPIQYEPPNVFGDCDMSSDPHQHQQLPYQPAWGFEWQQDTSSSEQIYPGLLCADKDFSGSDVTLVTTPQPAEGATTPVKEKYPCHTCQRSFNRQADLQRHNDHVHPPAHTAPTGHFCDYQRCARQVAAFHRKDHYRDHLREYHKEDLLKRGGNETAEWFADRNIKPDWWRCGRCLSRNSISRRGFTCHKCNTGCEPARVRHREQQGGSAAR